MYLAIDWGEKRIGLAVGAIFPQGAGVVDGEQSFEKIVEEIKAVITENEVEKIILGLPILPSGDEGVLAPQIRQFGKDLEKLCGLEVIYEPEEYTSIEAKGQFVSHSKLPDRKSGKLDEMAAILILEQFLDHIKDQSNF